MSAKPVNRRNRLMALLFILVACLGALGVRIGYWNIIKGEDLQEEAIGQWISDTVVTPKRGSIYDRNNNVLAQSAVSDTVVLVPERIQEPDKVADALSGILGMDRSYVYEKVSTKTKLREDGTEQKVGEVWLKRQIEPEQSEQITELDMKGVKLTNDTKRYYPNRDFASQVIGYTTMDGEGQAGIEKRYNNVLEGRQGRLVAETDKFNNDIPNGQEMYIEPVNGQNVVLTLDEIVQSFLETSCVKAYDEKGVQSVQGVVMDISTGEILGMANIPEFDLNEIPRDDADTLKSQTTNIITASAIEPGTIMTMFTAAAAMDAGVAEDSYSCSGKHTVEGEEILCTKSHGSQSFSEAVANGCKIASYQMVQKMGKKAFFEYLTVLGFGQKTGIDFTTDTKGDVMAMKYATEPDLAKMSAGENMQVSQLQLINAATSLVNGGNLYVPRLIYGFTDDTGGYTETFGLEIKEQSVQAEVSQNIIELMTELAAGSEEAQMRDYSSGVMYGKASKYDGNGALVEGQIVSTFMTLAPATNPKYIVMITLNGLGADSGSEYSAAPYVKNVMDEVLKYELVAPDKDVDSTQQSQGEEDGQDGEGEDDGLVEVPDVVDMGAQAARDTLTQAGFSYEDDGSGTVIGQQPDGGQRVEPGSTVVLEMDYKRPVESQSTEITADDGGNTVKVPDFSGMTLSSARDTAIASGLKFYAQGTGIAGSQYPLAGTSVPRGSTVTVSFKLDLD